ncbi:hypothetical protein E2C01_059791 [Portunus trituberculatus]|uniref:Uncharacterized protein n=1 Tax=Portunus trituberculatus TaxID=210409 RepID=A0A5B7H6C3_PORTR|nr:hypothetical protein [Portunus trituberculatus]
MHSHLRIFLVQYNTLMYQCLLTHLRLNVGYLTPSDVHSLHINLVSLKVPHKANFFLTYEKKSMSLTSCTSCPSNTSTAGMSQPRAATSVHRRMPDSALQNW